MTIGDIDPGIREVANRWLRTLTLITESADLSMAQRLHVVQEASHRQMTQPATDAGAVPIDPARQHTRELMMHAVVDELLIRWLSETTRATRGEVITRLVLAIDAMLPADDQP